jgi:lysyl-tRNA synthetase class 2
MVNSSKLPATSSENASSLAHQGQPAQQSAAASRTEQELVRIGKLEQLREKGFAFPNDIKVTGNSKTILEAPVIEPAQAPRFTLGGRIVQMRVMGKATFVHILDSHGKLQAYVRKDDVGEQAYEEFKTYDMGDIIELKGYPFVTKTGEKSLHAESVRLLTKSLIPLPEKWHGLSDTETRYRQRYVDLISNPEVRELFRKRTRIIKSIRNFLDERGYLEVETPVLEYTQGGTTAKPFRTFFNAIHTEMVLRIALELPLKKLVVGGLDRVYALGTVFRNEGLSKKHNPEFTMLEFYQAYATYEDLMTLSEELLVRLVQETNGTLKIPYGDLEVDFTPPYKRISMTDSLYEIGGIPREVDVHSLEGLLKICERRNIQPRDKTDWGHTLEDVWGSVVEPKLINPTFIMNHPFSTSPLARKNKDNPNVVDRFELIIAGMETANAFSELNDPIDQRQRLESQAARKAAGDEEASDADEDFLRAIDHGMPPTAGQGIGIDRLVMLLTNSPTIREVILFPHLKRESAAVEAAPEEKKEE